MQTEFKVNITVKDIFSFLINNTYRKLTGVIWIVFSIAVLVIAIYTWGDVKIANSILLIVMSLLYTVVNPIMLYLKAKAQVKNNDYFNDELIYRTNSKGITVCQGTESTTVKWDEMWKAVKYGGIVVVYVTTIRAFILPIRCIGEQYNNFVNSAADGLGNRCHLKKR